MNHPVCRSHISYTLFVIYIKEARTMVSIYKTLVRLHMLSPNYKKDKKLHEKVQCRFTKMINMEGSSYEEKLRRLNLWSLEERRDRMDLIEAFKMSHGKSIINFYVLGKNNKEPRGHSLKLTRSSANAKRIARPLQKYLRETPNIWELP